ncbi:DUF4383 domain-containing protein [Nocardiopsis alkaliphila]|uniref:DUF4383 domain-containing protein n=1 Tax=Nocardiopsis alkaliphila TaxID=225762 RepID=UPI000348C2AB|nr:DUF4383 domain-containing protein [Nocardiopsis alkaliphila]
MAEGITDPRQGGLAGNPLRLAALIVGVVFLLVGAMGFIPGLTTNMDQMQFAGHHSQTYLLGIFQVSILHNLVHLVFGVAGVAMSRTAGAARVFLLGGGVVYLVLWLYGLLIDLESAANFVPLNDAVNWLHFFLGVGMVVLGLVCARFTTTER